MHELAVNARQCEATGQASRRISLRLRHRSGAGSRQNRMATQVPFGDFVLDLDSRELRRGGRAAEIFSKGPATSRKSWPSGRPKAFSKAELQERLWPGTFVVEKNLANLVAEIREALGGHPTRSSGSFERFLDTATPFAQSAETPEDTRIPALKPDRWSFGLRIRAPVYPVPSSRRSRVSGGLPCGRRRRDHHQAGGVTARKPHGRPRAGLPLRWR